MPRPRFMQISLDETPFYHCVSKCVRGAFLCGFDKFSGKSYEHRRAWVEKEILYQSKVFAIEICAYAVMSNHTHLVLHVNRDRARSWSDREVLIRWHRLYRGTELTQQFVKSPETVTLAQRETLQATINRYRERLFDVSWFMRRLNEKIARRANREEECKGRFWEGRFKCQAILDEPALIANMVYVDLNPIRAKLATTPESSHYTSIKRRIEHLKNYQMQPDYLLPFNGGASPEGLSYQLRDYLLLVEETGRIMRGDKRGAISKLLPQFFTRIGISDDAWMILVSEFEARFGLYVGSHSRLHCVAAKLKQSRVVGVTQASRLFGV